MRLLFALIPIIAAAQQLQLGQINERVTSPANPKQQYALYLPSTYSEAKKYPVIFVFDPGGRALNAIELFRDGAEKYGYIVFCSWNSRNGAWDQTTAAMQTMWDEAVSRFSVDDKQLYTAGFSGGSRAALTFALASKTVAGVIAGGAGFATPQPPPKVPFASFITTSTEDFNWAEMQAVNRRLDKLRAPHRFTIVDGPHRWPQAATITQGMQWLRVQAIRANLIPKDPRLISAFTEERLAEIARMNEDPLAVLRAYQFLSDDLEGISNTAAWRVKAEEIRKSKQGKQAIKKELDEEHAMAGMLREFDRLLQAADAGPEGMPEARRWLQHQAGIAYSPEDSPNRRMVRRVTTGLSAQIMERRQEYEQHKKYDILARRLELAAELASGRVNAWVELAAVRWKMGNKKGAFEALEQGVSKGVLTKPVLDRAASIEELKADSRYQELLKKLDH